MTQIIDDERGFLAPMALISEDRYNLLVRTSVTCFTCDNSVRIGDALVEDLGWGYIEIPIDGNADTVFWECPDCAKDDRAA